MIEEDNTSFVLGIFPNENKNNVYHWIKDREWKLKAN